MDKAQLISVIDKMTWFDRMLPDNLRKLVLILNAESSGGMTDEVKNAIATIQEHLASVSRVVEDVENASAQILDSVDARISQASDIFQTNFSEQFQRMNELEARIAQIEAKNAA